MIFIKWFKKWRLMRSDIEVLNLKTKCVKALRRNKFYLIGHLCADTETELLKRGKLGRRSVNQIKAALALHGLHLRIVCPTCGTELDRELPKVERKVKDAVEENNHNGD